jgi:uncharacterized lipoprotein YbaY
MRSFPCWRAARAVATIAAGLALAPLCGAVRVDAAAPSASAVLKSPQQAAAAQTDESASLRHGVVTALDPRGARLQVQGIWLDVAADKTQLLRDGKPASVGTLRVGDTIRFTLAPAAADGQALRVIYVP